LFLLAAQKKELYSSSVDKSSVKGDASNDLKLLNKRNVYAGVCADAHAHEPKHCICLACGANKEHATPV